MAATTKKKVVTTAAQREKCVGKGAILLHWYYNYLKAYIRIYIKKHITTYTSFPQESTDTSFMYADHSFTLAATSSLFTVVLLPIKRIVTANIKYIFGLCQSLGDRVFPPPGGVEMFVLLLEC